MAASSRKEKKHTTRPPKIAEASILPWRALMGARSLDMSEREVAQRCWKPAEG